MRQMFQEAEETEAMNEWIIGLTKRSYRYRILSPVICLLSLPYLAPTKIYLISDCWGLHECGASPDHTLVQFLCVASGWVVAVCRGCCYVCACVAPLHVILNEIFCFVLCHCCCRSVEVRGVWGTTFCKHSIITKHAQDTLMQGHTLLFCRTH